jgi:hypothetical protein
VFVGHTDWKCYRVFGTYRHEVFSCLLGISTGSVLLFVGHTDRKCSRVCGTYGQEVFRVCGHTDMKCSRVCGAYRQEVFSCLWGIPTGSDLMSVWHTDRNVLGKVQQVFFLI